MHISSATEYYNNLTILIKQSSEKVKHFKRYHDKNINEYKYFS